MVTATKKRPMRPGWRKDGDGASIRLCGKGAAQLHATEESHGWAWEAYALDGNLFDYGTATTEAAAQRKADAALLRAAKRLAKAAGLRLATP